MLEEGHAYGGAGTDSYIIFKNSQNCPVNVNTYDVKGELSLYLDAQFKGYQILYAPS